MQNPDLSMDDYLKAVALHLNISLLESTILYIDDCLQYNSFRDTRERVNIILNRISILSQTEIEYLILKYS